MVMRATLLPYDMRSCHVPAEDGNKAMSIENEIMNEAELPLT